MILFFEDFTNYQSHELNEDLWQYQYGGHGWGNKELQCYVKSAKNLFIDHEGLHIKAIKEKINGNDYSSARIKSHQSFLYGKISFSVKIPKSLGSWPAIWMLAEEIKTKHNWPECGEIDLMEAVGRMPNKVHISLHSKNFNHVLNNHPTYVLDLNDNEFHEFSFVWNHDEINATIDGKFYSLFKRISDNQADWPFDKPHFIIMNLAIGGFFGGIVDPNFKEDEMVVKYLKIESLD